jgi:glycine oxidase
VRPMQAVPPRRKVGDAHGSPESGLRGSAAPTVEPVRVMPSEGELRVDRHAEVAIVGGGVVGLWCAFALAQSGADVAVLDPAPGRGASWTAAGMLAPATEHSYGEDSLLRLTCFAAQRYPLDMANLSEASGLDPGYRRTGAVEVAWDAADLAALNDLALRRTELGLSYEVLGSRALRRIEPGLAAGLPGGAFAAGDHQVDNRAMIASLFAALNALAVPILRIPVTQLLTRHERVIGVETADGTLLAPTVVLAAGAASGLIAGLPDGMAPPVHPVKGQTLRLRSSETIVEHVVRGRVRGAAVYIVPRANGEIVVGATSEESGFDPRSRTGAIHDLLRDALLLVPGLAEAEWLEVSTGFRPGTPDNGPIVGWSELSGLMIATGHYRNGVLLAPSTAAAVLAAISGDAMAGPYLPFVPERFIHRRIEA